MGSAKSKNRQLLGVAASPGIAIGRVRVADRSRVAVHEECLRPEELSAEVDRFINAIDEAREDLLALKGQISEQRGPEHLYIIDTIC